MAKRVGPDLYRCPRCEKEKPKSGFYTPHTKNNGISHYCKACEREMAAARVRAGRR